MNLCTQFFLLALTLAGIDSSLAQEVLIPRVDCEWRGGDYGDTSKCASDEVREGGILRTPSMLNDLLR